MTLYPLLKAMNIATDVLDNGDLEVRSPIDGSTIANVATTPSTRLDAVIDQSVSAFKQWRQVPAPRRGELVRLFGNKLRQHKQPLGELVTIECGKLLQEGLGEVQEMIDICDFAVGLSRQLYGLTIVSERPGHKMQELWQPLGPVGVISAFNFPVAVWSWNTALALVCGNSVIWKPSEKAPVTALVCQQLLQQACNELGDVPEGLNQVVIGTQEIGSALVKDRRVPLISATGSTAMGRAVAPLVAERFGRSILELGGNNAIILAPSTDLDIAIPAVVFGTVGTAGQRCTSTRRLFVHQDIYDTVLDRLKRAYTKVAVGNPLESTSLVGPLIEEDAYRAMQTALTSARQAGAKVIGGERIEYADYSNAYYVQPSLVEMPEVAQSQQHETFAPILYVYPYADLCQAIALQNDVPQGLSSAIFTTDIRESELFTSSIGSDCGIANINIGTSGAEIGGAFGGEKETGGGRESGSDAWKAYMRRMTTTINYSRELPLVQGIVFDIGDD